MGSDRFIASAHDDLQRGVELFKSLGKGPVVTICGSARTAQDSPLSSLAHDVALGLAQRGWHVVTGAGPGIMEAANRGAGEASSVGVNIELPFEHGTNPHINVGRQVTMNHFFTRKVIMTRASQAFVFLPGGVGTLDELYEVLTLLHTAKTPPLPVVLLDVPDGQFWSSWATFMEERVISAGYLSSDDARTYDVVTSATQAVSIIDRFYRNFVDYELRNGRASMRLQFGPTPAELTTVRELFADALWSPEERMLRFTFEGRNYALLRRLIDSVNGWTH